MTWAGFWTFIKALPALVSLYFEVKKQMEIHNQEVDSAQRLKDLKEGLKDARENKDTTKLNSIFNPNLKL